MHTSGCVVRKKYRHRVTEFAYLEIMVRNPCSTNEYAAGFPMMLQSDAFLFFISTSDKVGTETLTGCKRKDMKERLPYKDNDIEHNLLYIFSEK